MSLYIKLWSEILGIHIKLIQVVYFVKK